MAERFKRILKDHGEEAVLKKRAIGVRDAVTGQSEISYVDEDIVAYVSHPLSRRIDINGLVTTEETRTIFTYHEIAFQDRIVCRAGTFSIENEPAAIFKMNNLIFYTANMLKVDVG